MNIKLALVLIFLFAYQTIIAQQNHLDIEGHAKIRGNLDIGHMDDTTTVLIGLNAGVLVDSFPGFNTFVGYNTGPANSLGRDNSFFGSRAGEKNTTGSRNSFYGLRAGNKNTAGADNSFFGFNAGRDNQVGGERNSFFGKSSGVLNTTGFRNSFYGFDSGLRNTIGTRNTFIGYGADQASLMPDSLDRATAIGYNAKVDCSNCLVLGGTGVDSVLVGIGTSRPENTLEVVGDAKIEGTIILTQSEPTAPAAGTIRWTGSDFQGWTGAKWVSLTTGVAFEGEVKDIDGNVYPTIKIGNQEWMAENLRTGTYNDGTDINHEADSAKWSNATEGAWCWYDNDSSNDLPYGKLYNWYAVNDGGGLCPTGWHVPTDPEWTTLTDFLGGLSIAGGPMKEAGTAHWQSPNGSATNSTGFSGLPGGFRTLAGTFHLIVKNGSWWSSTELGSLNGWYRWLNNINGNVNGVTVDKKTGHSVRCVKD